MSEDLDTLQTLQEQWEQASGDVVELDAKGKIVDFLDSSKSRPDKPEERIRQGYARILVQEYQYPKEQLAFEAPINIGSETKYADIAVYDSPESRALKDQGRIILVVETKAPNKKDGRGQLTSYIFASSSSGGVWTNGGAISYFRRLDQPHQHLKEWTNIPRFGTTCGVV